MLQTAQPETDISAANASSSITLTNLTPKGSPYKKMFQNKRDSGPGEKHITFGV
jgi:hypothetical protein